MPIHLLFHHFFIPRETNNHRPKILHQKSLFVLILIIIILSVFTFTLRTSAPQVLGVATNISVSDLLSLTNQKRQEQGLAPVTLNKNLVEAAHGKASNMFTKDYWAHNAPDGTTPWVFIQEAGYNYVYAGENLAKDFNDSKGVVSAWMASSSHRENMLSPKYTDIGFAVVNGKLNGEETTLVVEIFGSQQHAKVATLASESAKTQRKEAVVSEKPLVFGVTNNPLVNSKNLTKRIAFFVLAILLLAFVLDLIYVERNKLIRLVSHNSDHISFLIGAAIIVLLLGGGVIL